MDLPKSRTEHGETDDVAIVGIDCRFPGAPNTSAFWDLLVGGHDGVGRVPGERWDPNAFHDPELAPGNTNTTSGGFITDADAFDYEVFRISPREAAVMDPQQRLLLQTTWRSLEDAGFNPRVMGGSRTGVFVGVMGNEWALLHLNDFEEVTPQLASGNGYYMTANRLSYYFNLKGPSMAVDTACSSSLVSTHMASTALRRGECDFALAAGVNLVLTPTSHIFYAQAGLSAPDGRCKPFSAEADGIGRAEGVAVLVLRRLEDAMREQQPIYAVIKGGAVNHDGRSNGLTAPSRWTQQQVIEDAYAAAGVKPQQVSYVEGHGTGTALGDMIEVRALGAVHGVERERRLALGSVKGNIGHAEGAAGIAGVVKVALALSRRTVPPSRYARQENPQLGLADAGLRLLQAPVRLLDKHSIAGVSSFGLGGTNAHLVLASAPSPAPRARRGAAARDDPGVGVLTVSPTSAEALRRNLRIVADDVAARPHDRLPAVCWTSNHAKTSLWHRFAIPVAERDNAVAALRRAADSADPPGNRPSGRPVVGFLFTGQGAQYRRMTAALHRSCPPYRQALSDVDAEMLPHLGFSVSELVLGGGDVQQTEITQPALFAVEYALARALTELGIEPAWAVGHSIGEYAAACLAGALTLPDACRLVVARGRLMQELPEPGAMLAVRAGVQRVAHLLDDEPLVDVGAVNAPSAIVLSGDAATLERIRVAVDADSISTRWLPVSHAFHSPLMEPMLDEFSRTAQRADSAPPAFPIYSTLREEPIGDGSGAFDAAYWTEQIRKTVRFADALDAAMETEPTHLIEVGPRAVLTPLVREVRPGSTARRWALCSGEPSTGQEIATAVARLYQDGSNPHWRALYTDTDRVCTRMPRYVFDTAARFPVSPSRRPRKNDRPEQLATPGVDENVHAADAPLPGSDDTNEARAETGRVSESGHSFATRLVELIAGVGGYAAADISPDMALFEDLGYDSIVIAQIKERIEQHWPELSPLPMEEVMYHLGSVGDLVTYLNERQDKHSPRKELT